MRSEPLAAATPQGSRRIAECNKGERAFTSIWDTWQNDEIYRKSQLAHNWSDAWVRYLDHIVQFNIYRNAPQSQRERYVNLLHVRSVDENKQAPPLWQRPRHREAKKEVSNRQMSREEQVLSIQVSDRRRLQNKIDPSLQEYLEWLSVNWAEQFAEPQNSERPTTIIIIFQLVTKPNMVEFVFIDSKLAEMAPAQVARRQMVKTVVNETASNSRSQISRNSIQKLVRPDSRRQSNLNVVTINRLVSDCLVPMFLQKLMNLSFALSQQQQPAATAVRGTYLFARRRTFLSCAHHSAQLTH